jgi:hypothetical protein
LTKRFHGERTLKSWLGLVCSLRTKISKNWFIMQCIKEVSTLRVSTKREKPEPRIVYRFGSQNGQIAEFLAFRKLVKNISRKVISKVNNCLQVTVK